MFVVKGLLLPALRLSPPCWEKLAVHSAISSLHGVTNPLQSKKSNSHDRNIQTDKLIRSPQLIEQTILS
jgi:hypothetical protein